MNRAALTVCCLFTLLRRADVTGEPCEQIAATYVELSIRVSRCTEGEVPMAIDLATCRASTAGCTASDLRAIDRFLDCAKELPACEAGGASVWLDSYEACGAGIHLSDSCSL